VTFKDIHLPQAFPNVIFRTAAQQFTRYQLT